MTDDRAAAAGCTGAPKTFRAMFDRTSDAVDVRGSRRPWPDVVELRGRRSSRLARLRSALAREVLVDKGRSVTKGFGVRMIAKRARQRHPDQRGPGVAQAQPSPDQPGVLVHGTEEVRRGDGRAAAMRADERWQAGQVVEITDEMGRIALDVVGRTLLGDETDSDARTVIDCARGHPANGSASRSCPARPGCSRPTCRRRRRSGTRSTPCGPRSSASSATTSAIASDRDDIVAALLAATEDGEGFTEQQVLDETLDPDARRVRDHRERAVVDLVAARPEPDVAAQAARRVDATYSVTRFRRTTTSRGCPTRWRPSPRRCGCDRRPGSSSARRRTDRPRRLPRRRRHDHPDQPVDHSPRPAVVGSGRRMRIGRIAGSMQRARSTTAHRASRAAPTSRSVPAAGSASASSSRGRRPCSCWRRWRDGGHRRPCPVST